ncbi:MAG TPA: hypothetical protein VFE58_09025 [Tepidisphaeraceae bacterium]|jgi:hypothetical protein|nr:hypothetical protein [Tepidisphaeraceae bacterium]
MLFQKCGILMAILASWIFASIDPHTFLTDVGSVISAVTAFIFGVQHFIQFLDARKAGKKPVDASRVVPGFAVAGLLLAALILPGCAATPLQRVSLARQGYTATLKVATAMRQAGEIDDATALRIEALRVAAANYLDQVELSVKSGGGVTAQVWDALTAALNAYEAEITAAKKVSANGPTGNSGISQFDYRGGVEPHYVGSYAANRGPRPDAGGRGGGEGGSGSVRSGMDRIAA